MKTINPVSVVTGIVLVCTGIGSECAETPPVSQLSFDLTGVGNYVLRGVSHTENNPAIFALARFNYDQFYATTGARSIS